MQVALKEEDALIRDLGKSRKGIMAKPKLMRWQVYYLYIDKKTFTHRDARALRKIHSTSDFKRLINKVGVVF